MTTTTTTITTQKPTLSTSSPPRIDGDVTATLNFYDPPPNNETPYNYVSEPPPGHPQRNFGVAAHDVRIHDIRGHESDYTLDRDAFAALPATTVPLSATTSPTFNWDDDAQVKAVYYPEIEQLLLTHPALSTERHGHTVSKPHKIIIFDHTVRRSDPSAPRAPVTRAHVDQTAKSTAARVRLHASSADEAEALLNGRVEASPLAFASATSVDRAADLVPVEHRYPDRTGETAQVKYSDRMWWAYWSGMDDDERLLLKCWDTLEGEGGAESIGKCVPHTAFVDPRTEGVEGVKGRESCEVRALVFG